MLLVDFLPFSMLLMHRLKSKQLSIIFTDTLSTADGIQAEVDSSESLIHPLWTGSLTAGYDGRSKASRAVCYESRR